jgi:MoxR-like ATPase
VSASRAGSSEPPEGSLEQVLYQVKRVIVGQDVLLERMVVALLARGHLLVEGVPGLAKTLAVKTMADALGVEFQRIQFTPDLVPADIVGTRIYNQKAGEFQVSLGPVFANLVRPTRSTGRRPRSRARCWRPCRNARSRSVGRPICCPTRSW